MIKHGKRLTVEEVAKAVYELGSWECVGEPEGLDKNTIDFYLHLDKDGDPQQDMYGAAESFCARGIDCDEVIGYDYDHNDGYECDKAAEAFWDKVGDYLDLDNEDYRAACENLTEQANEWLEENEGPENLYTPEEVISHAGASGNIGYTLVRKEPGRAIYNGEVKWYEMGQLKAKRTCSVEWVEVWHLDENGKLDYSEIESITSYREEE